MTNKICIITPGTIASNPRVVKEAEALSEAGYKVHIIYSRHVKYLIEQDNAILAAHPDWTYDYLDWADRTLNSTLIRVLSGIKRKISNLILKFGLFPESTAGFLLNRFYFWQLSKARNFKADLYIAHYPDSIAIAATAAKLNNALFAFDAEDYHRGEDIPEQIVKAITSVENKFLKNASYISASSPLIVKAYQKLYPQVEVFNLENLFPLRYQPRFIPLKNDIYKFLWFSQTIGPKRGLEEFILILGLTGRKNVQLTLLGNYTPVYQSNLDELWLKSNLKPELLVMIPTVPEKEIFQLASEHHFGLALEVPHSLNRDFCLTNKLFTYILSGNVLILSDTQAQREFHNSFPKTGICIDLKKIPEASAQIVTLLNGLELNEQRSCNFELGRYTLNFDLEKEKILSRVRQILE